MNRIILFFLLAIITLGTSGCIAHDNRGKMGFAVNTPASAEPTPSPALTRNYIAPIAATSRPEDVIVKIGDDLEVDVAEDRSFNGIYEVRLGGYIILPAVGRIQAVGLPLKGVETNITKALEETQLPHATVKVNKLGETHIGKQRH